MTKKIYQLDKSQIADCFIDNVEYFRLYHRYDYHALNYLDSIKKISNEYYQKHPQAEWDAANFFEPYSSRYSMLIDNYVNSPLPTKDQLKVTTDTIFYNKTGLLCVAFLVIENKYSKIKGLEDARKKDREFDARAMIGYRISNDSLFNMYPLNQFDVIGVESYTSAISTLKQLYCTKLTSTSGGASGVYNQIPFKQNVGDSDFFEKSPYFLKYDSMTYNFQMYRHLGKDFHYNYHCCE